MRGELFSPTHPAEKLPKGDFETIVIRGKIHSADEAKLLKKKKKKKLSAFKQT